MSPVELVADAADADLGGEAIRIDHLHRRRPEHGHSRGLEQRDVFGFAPGISRQVFSRAKLHRIDEDRRDHLVGTLSSLGDQRHVAGVKRAHGRDEGKPAFRF
jgi:hypothetical protein